MQTSIKGRRLEFATVNQNFDSSGCQQWSRLEASEKGVIMFLVNSSWLEVLALGSKTRGFHPP